MNKSEAELVEALQNGESHLLAEYLNVCRLPLLAFILKNMSASLRSKVEAEDIYQEVCSYAIQSVDEVDFGQQQPFGWFCEIARRRIVDIQRRFSAQKRSAHNEVGIFGRGNSDQTGLVNLLVASITSPSAAFSRQQKEFKLVTAMEQLKPDQQEVLRLRYGLGLPSKDIATQIGKSDGATRVLITRSLKKLEGLLAEGDLPGSETDRSEDGQ